MKFLKRLLFFLVGLIVLLAVVGLFLPKSVSVQRSVQIDQSPAVVFGYLDNFKKFNEWSPWAERDPNTKYTFSGPESGAGAKMSWESDHPQVGSGSQEIKAVDPGKEVKVNLDFGDNGQADAFYKVDPKDGGSHVTWGFTSDFGYNLIGRYMGLFFDKWIGADYEKGLASLKTLVEKIPRVDYSDLAYEVIEIEPRVVIAKEVTAEANAAAISQALGAAYGEILGFIAQNGLNMTGQPLTINRPTEDQYRVDAAIPVDRRPTSGDDATGIRVIDTFAGKVIKAVHTGAYTTIPSTYEKINALMAEKNMQAADAPWEEYISDPTAVPEAELITHIYFPIITP